jgi:hypothetical protein
MNRQLIPREKIPAEVLQMQSATSYDFLKLKKTSFRDNNYVNVTDTRISNSKKNSISIPLLQIPLLIVEIFKLLENHEQWKSAIKSGMSSVASIAKVCKKFGFTRASNKAESDVVCFFQRYESGKDVAEIQLLISYILCHRKKGKQPTMLKEPLINLSICKYANHEKYEESLNFQSIDQISLLLSALEDFVECDDVVDDESVAENKENVSVNPRAAKRQAQHGGGGSAGALQEIKKQKYGEGSDDDSYNINDDDDDDNDEDNCYDDDAAYTDSGVDEEDVSAPGPSKPTAVKGGMKQMKTKWEKFAEKAKPLNYSKN